MMYLSNKQNDILKLLYLHSYDIRDICDEFNLKSGYEPIKELKELKFVKYEISYLNEPPIVHITEKGKAYIDQLHFQEDQTRKLYRHNWKITLFNTIGGAIAGLITSIAFWLLTN